MTLTVAGQADVRQRLDADGIGALGLAGPLLARTWTAAAPTVDVAALTFSVAAPWYAPLAGMAVAVAEATELGLSLVDGAPAAGPAVVLKVHPHARLRLERVLVATLQAAGGPVDQSLRPVPASVLIRNPLTGPDPTDVYAAGELGLPGGLVSFHDEHGLAVDPFAFAAAVAAVLGARPVLGATDPGGTGVAAIVALAPAGRFVHLVDLHGRPWVDPPGAAPGVSLYTGAVGSRTEGTHLGDAAVTAWSPAAAVLASRSDPDGAAIPAPVAALRFGWSTVGRMGTAPLTWPPDGAAVPARDTLRVTVTDPVFHLLGNRTASSRESVGAADAITVAEPAPLVRDGSPLALLPDARSCLGFLGATILGLQGGNPAAPFTSGPIFLAGVRFDDAAWALPTAPGAPGRWPASPAAVPVPGNEAAVLGQFAPLRSGTSAAWIAGGNDVLLTLPAGLPVGSAVRIYPRRVLLGTSPDEQPLLQRADGGATLVTGGTDTVVLRDPLRFGSTLVRDPGLEVWADAAVTWQPVTGPAVVKLLGNLRWTIGTEVPPPAPGPGNLLGAQVRRGSSAAPLLGAPATGGFDLTTVLGDPVAWLQDVVRQLSSDQNPREAPRLPTMARTETLLAVQLPAAQGPDLYRSVLTGAWPTREADTASHRLANPGAEGAHEVQGPGVAATGQLGFDLWVAAAHRTSPVVPTADIAAPFGDGPNAGLPMNWVLLQANDTSVPPAAPAVPSTIAAALLQTVPAYVETPELALIPDDDEEEVIEFVTQTVPNYLTVPNQPEINRQLVREISSCKHGRRDAQWALRRALRQARELVYVETPLLAATAHGAGGPEEAFAAVDLVAELAARLAEEPRLRVVIMVPRTPPFAEGFEPFAMHFYAARTAAAQALGLAGGEVDGPHGKRPRVIIAHPMGIPGRPVVIRTTTVVVDDVWLATGTSSLSRRGLTFDGANDVVLTDWQLDRGAGVAVRAHRKALMAQHLGVGPGTAGTGGGAPASRVGAPAPDWVRLHQPIAAHEAVADLLAAGGNGKLLPLWSGPDASQPDAVLPHPPEVADPDGRAGATFLTTVAAALGGSPSV